MKAGALLAVLLGFVVLVQATEILLNPDMNGCLTGSMPTFWTGAAGDLAIAAFSSTFTNEAPGDTCFAFLSSVPLMNTLTQTITVPSTGSYDFSGLAACCFGSSGDSCAYTLTINGQNFPLTGGSFAASDRCTFFPVTASGITLTAGTYPLVFTTNFVGGPEAAVTFLSLVTSGGGSGDPHFVGFQGQRFDYIGEADQVINLVSDPSLQVNTLLGLQKAGDATFIPGPVMMEMAFMTRGHTVSINAGGYQKDQVGFVSVDGALLPLGDSFLDDILSVTFTALNANSKDLGLTGNDHIVSQVDVKLEGLYEFRVFMIENGRDPEHPERWMVKYPHRFLDFNASLLDEDRRPHGVLGQTAAPLSKDRSVVEWTIEGKDEDYVVKDGLTGTQFTFNQFQ